MRKIHYVDLLVCPRISTGFWFLNFWTKPCCAKGRRQRPFLLPAEWLRAIKILRENHQAWWWTGVFHHHPMILRTKGAGGPFLVNRISRPAAWFVAILGVSKCQRNMLLFCGWRHTRISSPSAPVTVFTCGQDHLRHLKNKSGLAWWTIPVLSMIPPCIFNDQKFIFAILSSDECKIHKLSLVESQLLMKCQLCWLKQKIRRRSELQNLQVIGLALLLVLGVLGRMGSFGIGDCNHPPD